jgi:hypothetical protein
MKRLLRAHRKSDRERDRANVEAIEQQSSLGLDVVVDGHSRKPAPRCGPPRITRRRGEPAAEKVDAHDEVAFGIERSARTDQPRVVAVGSTIRRRKHHRIRAVCIERAVDAVGELRVAQNGAALEREVAEGEAVVVVVHPRPFAAGPPSARGAALRAGRR